ncbi:MAG: hypothetical protein ACUVTY_10910 [Armatimonadota bacterium]
MGRLRRIIYGRDFANIFILQYLMGNLVPFVMLLLPKLTIRDGRWLASYWCFWEYS